MAVKENPRRSSQKGKSRKLSKTLKVGPFRMAFPALLEPEEDDSGQEVYKMTMLFPPKYDMAEIEDAMQDVMEDAFGDERDWPSGRNDILPEDKLYDAGKKEYAGFKKGWMAMSCRSHEQPGLIDADKNEVVKKREVYGGRWARAQITITTYDNKSKGVGVYLNHVQLLDHDEAFSGRGSAEDAFDKYELKDKGRRRDDDDDEEEAPKRGRSRDRDDDDSDRGARSSKRGTGRGRDDDDSEDKPRSRTRSRDDDDDEEEKPRKRNRNDDDDADEKPRRRGAGDSRRSRDDAEDEDKPRKRRASRDDDEEDERPRKRASRDEWN